MDSTIDEGKSKIFYYFSLIATFLFSFAGIAYFFYSGAPSGTLEVTRALLPVFIVGGFGKISGDDNYTFTAIPASVLFMIYIAMR